MKKYIFYFVLLSVLFSCKKETNYSTSNLPPHIEPISTGDTELSNRSSLSYSSYSKEQLVSLYRSKLSESRRLATLGEVNIQDYLPLNIAFLNSGVPKENYCQEYESFAQQYIDDLSLRSFFINEYTCSCIKQYLFENYDEYKNMSKEEQIAIFTKGTSVSVGDALNSINK